MPCESPANPPFRGPFRSAWEAWQGADIPVHGLCQPCQLVPIRDHAPTQMGAGIAAGPHCRRCWHPGFPAPELTASFRRSLPFGFRPFGWSPQVRLAVRSLLLGRIVLLARLSVLRRPQFLTAWAWQSLAPVASFLALPRVRLLRACFLRFPSGAAPAGSALRPRHWTVPPSGREGPFRAFWRAAPRLRLSRLCPRSCDHRSRRISFASGRQSGIRNRPFRFAIRLFQNAPQHAESGFNTYFPVRLDQEISAFRSVPCGAFLGLHFPLDKTDAALRR